MNPDCGSVEFAHARIRARWGMRPDESAWHRIEITRELAPLLDLARAGSLARWVQGLAAGAGPHAIEYALRRRWRETVDEVARWMSSDWQASIRWCAHLVDLPAAQQWARGEAAAAWTTHDEGLRAADEAGPIDPSDPFDPTHPIDPAWRTLLRRARGEPAQVLASWLRTWRERLPAGSARGLIERALVPSLMAHASAFAAPAAVHGWSQRRALKEQLVGLLRRHPIEPIEAFTHLALQALELERLRAEVVGRAAFPQRTLHA